MGGVFSVPPLRALIGSGHKPLALVTPPPPGAVSVFRRIHFPLPGSSDKAANVYELASTHMIPIYEIGALEDPRALQLLADSHPDFIIAACFTQRLPAAWLRAPRRGCINLHPSLLPAYRGPTPLEDQLAGGETGTGITLHFMDEGFDTGDIISQVSLPIQGGATLKDLNRQAAEAGAQLLLEILERPDSIPRRPQ